MSQDLEVTRNYSELEEPIYLFSFYYTIISSQPLLCNCTKK